MKLIVTDGGRKDAGLRGKFTGDCVVRSIALASGRPYRSVHNDFKKLIANKLGYIPEDGILTNKRAFKRYMLESGFVWNITCRIGSRDRVHMNAAELPMGRLVLSLSKHYTAVINHVIYDTYDPSNNGTRMVYGFWSFEPA
jgi:hypothetical protein